MHAFLNFSERVLKMGYIIIFDSIIAMSLVCSFFWPTLYFVQLQIDKRLIVIFAQMRASLMFIWAE